MREAERELKKLGKTFYDGLICETTTIADYFESHERWGERVCEGEPLADMVLYCLVFTYSYLSEEQQKNFKLQDVKKFVDYVEVNVKKVYDKYRNDKTSKETGKTCMYNTVQEVSKGIAKIIKNG